MPTFRSCILIASAIAAPALASAEPRVVLATDPIAPLHGHYALSASYALGSHVAIRADAAVGDRADQPDGHALAQGSVSLQLFLDRAFHGPFLEPGLVVRRTPMFGALVEDPGGYGVIADDFHILPEVLLGWQWLYHDRYSLAVAAGAAAVPQVPYGVLGEPTYSTETYVRLGYAF